jgi:hypothetical protein
LQEYVENFLRQFRAANFSQLFQKYVNDVQLQACTQNILCANTVHFFWGGGGALRMLFPDPQNKNADYRDCLIK